MRKKLMILVFTYVKISDKDISFEIKRCKQLVIWKDTTMVTLAKNDFCMNLKSVRFVNDDNKALEKMQRENFRMMNSEETTTIFV